MTPVNVPSTTHTNMRAVVRPGPGSDRDKALRILAKSIFKELKAQGYDSRHIVGLATELIGCVTTDLSQSSDASR